jgi:hypothetical protein
MHFLCPCDNLREETAAHALHSVTKEQRNKKQQANISFFVCVGVFDGWGWQYLPSHSKLRLLHYCEEASHEGHMSPSMVPREDYLFCGGAAV